jgi:hypothetical protein
MSTVSRTFLGQEGFEHVRESNDEQRGRSAVPVTVPTCEASQSQDDWFGVGGLFANPGL